MFKLVYWGIAALLVSGADSAAMSLSEAVRLAVETNPNVEAAEARYRQSEQRLKQSMGRLYPEIDILGEYGKYKIDRPEGLGPDVN
ncbi:MAG: TolC family protein, partial [Rhizobiaceae bacterium]